MTHKCYFNFISLKEDLELCYSNGSVWTSGICITQVLIQNLEHQDLPRPVKSEAIFSQDPQGICIPIFVHTKSEKPCFRGSFLLTDSYWGEIELEVMGRSTNAAPEHSGADSKVLVRKL